MRFSKMRTYHGSTLCNFIHLESSVLKMQAFLYGSFGKASLVRGPVDYWPNRPPDVIPSHPSGTPPVTNMLV